MERRKFDLDQLLKAKRFEVPDEAFWDAFDARLKKRLVDEVQPRRVSWKEIFGLWLRRWALVTTVGLFVFGSVFHLFRSDLPRLETCYRPSDIRSCRSISFCPSASLELAKSVLQKKSVALTDNRHFTF